MYRGERYLSCTEGIYSPRLEHIFTNRSLAVTAHVDLLFTCSTDSCTRMPPSITVFIHRVIPLNEYPFSNPLGLMARGSPHLKLQALVMSYSGDPKGRFDSVFSLGVIPIAGTPFSHLLGVGGRGRSHLKLLALVIPYSGNPKERFDTVLTSVSFPLINAPFRHPLGLLAGGIPHLKLLAFGYSILKKLKWNIWHSPF